MPSIKSEDCLAGSYFGYHFEKTRFSIANHFNDLADELTNNIPYTNILEIGSKGLTFNLGEIGVQLNLTGLNVFTQIEVSENIKKHFPISTNSSTHYAPMYFGPPFERGRFRTENTRVFRTNFIKNTKEILTLIDRFIPSGLPKCRFVGWVEHYYIPLRVINWDILEEFKEHAQIEGMENTEKITTNTYYSKKTKEGDESCLIFKVIKPDDHITTDKNVIAASTFDYQLHPGTSKSVDEFGGSEKLIHDLTTRSSEVINKSGFLTFSKRK